MLVIRFAWALALLLHGASLAAETRPFDVDDLVRLARVSDPELSPDGRLVAYALRETDMAGDRGISGLWLVPANGGAQPVRLTEKVSNASSPRWAPDGRALYFLSDRAGSLQVWKLPLEGGEARQVTAYPLPVGVFAVSPRGDQLLVGLSVLLDCEDLECTRRAEVIESWARRRYSYASFRWR